MELKQDILKKTLKEMATSYARILNQYKFEYHLFFSASFYKINEEDQRSDESVLFFNLKIIHILTETDIDNIDVESQLEHQIQIQEAKESGWFFDKINSMKIKLYKTGELNDSRYAKLPLRSSAIQNIKDKDKYCFI